VQTLSEEFNQALVRIQIRGQKRERAQEAHSEVRAVLEGSPRLRDWGIDTILIGSYARDTGVHPGKDVDVFGKLTALDTSSEPAHIFNEFAKVLENQYGKTR
jgi:tRNA nucleotidyltransferase (CCA-adding enzyme)